MINGICGGELIPELIRCEFDQARGGDGGIRTLDTPLERITV
jgi:hypothetical protein